MRYDFDICKKAVEKNHLYRMGWAIKLSDVKTGRGMRQLRNTRQRKIVLEMVQKHDDHPSADQIYLEIRAKDPKFSRGTVYRNLNVLSEEGQITHVKVPGADRYDHKTEFHYHSICMSCGAVRDIPFSYGAKLDETIAAESGYQITRHRLIFEGICPECQKNGHGE